MAKELTITRIIDAPVDIVWKAWTDSEYFKRWWGPKGFTAPDNKMDLRVGGKYLSSMLSPDGQKFWNTGVFREIVRHKRLVVTDSFADEKGNVVPASHYGMSADFPKEMQIAVTFGEVPGGKTKITLKHGGTDTLPDKDLKDMEQGWGESLDKLAVLMEEISLEALDAGVLDLATDLWVASARLLSTSDDLWQPVKDRMVPPPSAFDAED